MKRILQIIIFLMHTVILNAQEKLNYQLKGKIIEFAISEEDIYVEFDSNQKSFLKQMINNEFEELTNNSAILKMNKLKGSFQERKQGLKSKVSINFKRIEPVLVYSDGVRQVAKGEINIKLKPNTSLNGILGSYDFSYQVNEFEKDLYLVKMDGNC